MGIISFADIESEDWFYNDVMALVNLDAISGYPYSTFGPLNPIIRAEASAIVHRLISKETRKVVDVNTLH